MIVTGLGDPSFLGQEATAMAVGTLTYRPAAYGAGYAEETYGLSQQQMMFRGVLPNIDREYKRRADAAGALSDAREGVAYAQEWAARAKNAASNARRMRDGFKQVADPVGAVTKLVEEAATAATNTCAANDRVKKITASMDALTRVGFTTPAQVACEEATAAAKSAQGYIRETTERKAAADASKRPPPGDTGPNDTGGSKLGPVLLLGGFAVAAILILR